MKTKRLRVGISSLIALLAAGAMAQVQMGEAKPVDIHVTRVDWQPAGLALIYAKEVETGIAIGAFGPSRYEGKEMLMLSKDATFSPYWFEKQASVMLSTRQSAPEVGKDCQRVSLYLIDADTQKVNRLFDEVYRPGDEPKVIINNSPLLRHSIVTMRFKDGSRHFVLCQGNNSLVPCPDLDRPEAQKLSGPAWSVDGTAVYGDFPNLIAAKYRLEYRDQELKVDNANAAATKENLRELKLAQQIRSEAEDLVMSRAFALNMAPPAGTDVLELMPTNPVLRPVKFRGSFKPEPFTGPTLQTQNGHVVVQFERSNAEDNSLWLKLGVEKNSPASMVAVHASDAWLSPISNAIAYTIDGALFVRPIKK